MQRVRDVKSYDPSLWQLWFHGVHSSKGAVMTSLQPPSKFDQAWKYCLRSDISRPQQTKKMEFRVFMNLRSFNTWGCTVVRQEKSYGSESEAAGTSTCKYWVKMHPTVKLLRLIHLKIPETEKLCKNGPNDPKSSWESSPIQFPDILPSPSNLRYQPALPRLRLIPRSRTSNSPATPSFAKDAAKIPCRDFSSLVEAPRLS